MTNSSAASKSVLPTASAPTPASAINNSSTDKSNWALYSVIVIGGLGLLSYGFSFFTTSRYLGGEDKWNQIQPIFSSIYGPALGGCILLCIALGIYITQMMTNPNVLYILLFISLLALCFSYIAVAMAVITKSA